MSATNTRKRGGQSIKPTEIKNIYDWINAYTSGAANLVVGEDNTLLVLDPSSKDVTRPVKTIPHKMGFDFDTVLSNPTTTEELRASAETKRNTLLNAMHSQVTLKIENYKKLEKELLDVSYDYAIASDAEMKKSLARAVGELTKGVAEAERELRQAMYPHRYVKLFQNVTYKHLNPASGDDRALNELKGIDNSRFNVVSRVITTATDRS